MKRRITGALIGLAATLFLRRRGIVSTVVELVGVAAVAVAAEILSPGLAIVGVYLFLVGLRQAAP